jgi:signal transduction histidine kinase
VRRRLALAIVGVTTLAVVLLAVPLGIVLQRSYRQQELLRLQRDTVAATRRIDLGARDDPVELPTADARIGVYDADGSRVAGTGPERADAVALAALRTGRPSDAGGAGALRVAVPLVVSERVRGVVRATRSAAPVTDRARRAWAALAGLAILLVALAAAAATGLARVLAAPLERLAITARRLGDGDFAVRAERSGVAEVDAVGASLDVTARRLDDLLNRERAFTADASHQLRTPLASLRLELEAMELRGERSPELVAALSQVDRLQTTVETLLAVARDAVPGSACTDLVALAEELEERWHGELSAAARPLRISVRARPPVARANPLVVSEILDVLVSNALVHGAGAVEVAIRDVAGSPAIDVADEGPGLGDDPDAAFARRAGGRGGHGIGLAMARSLAHAEAGRLVVTRPGPRPVFTVLLPAGTEDARARGAA